MVTPGTIRISEGGVKNDGAIPMLEGGGGEMMVGAVGNGVVDVGKIRIGCVGICDDTISVTISGRTFVHGRRLVSPISVMK